MGYQPGISLDGISIVASGADLDGAGNLLGQANWTDWSVQAGYWLATAGYMTFDTADLAVLEADGLLLPVILHEMAHVLGFGTMWFYNGVYSSLAAPGQYHGANALVAYRQEFGQPEATYVPVELDGGLGTAHVHWDELTSVVNADGRPLTEELMTGFLDTPAYLSRTTIQSFADIGYVVVPESATWGMVLGLVALGIGRRWRARSIHQN